ncbi:hypothetical protein BG58_03795 [Caballeronia jiangsuensis]|nr:hypothetical protein BG58_03795 [Caballeronia jiangsuensis]
MVIYHHGAAVQPSVVHVGHTFVARALVQNEDRETESRLNLGTFANKNAAMQFAILSALAYVDGKPLPHAPCQGIPQ